MTPQEAIKFINNEVQIDVRFCTDETIEKTKEAFELAISALEKQIPIKPLDKTFEFDGYYGLCPCCNTVVCESKNFNMRCYCGQALDWSDTE